MIIDVFINLFTGIVNFFLDLLPEASFSTDITDGITGLFQGAYAYNSILPIDTLFAVVGASVTFIGLIFLWQGIKYILHMVRGN